MRLTFISWLLTFIPFLVTSAAGAQLVPSLSVRIAVATLVVSFMSWSIGIILCHLILAIYLYRLISCNLPLREAIVSCFVPTGPTGMGAYSIQLMARGMNSVLHRTQFTFNLPAAGYRSGTLDAVAVHAVAESVVWLGLILGLALLAEATFWLVFAVAAFVTKIPRSFNVGFWSFVFPCGVYSLGLGQAALDLRNDGLAGYAAAWSAITILLWLVCALATLYKGVWCARLFFAPGLEGWHERMALKQLSNKGRVNSDSSGQHQKQSACGSGRKDSSQVARVSQPDGTYSLTRLRRWMGSAV